MKNVGPITLQLIFTLIFNNISHYRLHTMVTSQGKTLWSLPDCSMTLYHQTIWLIFPIPWWFNSAKDSYYWVVSTHILWVRPLHPCGDPGSPWSVGTCCHMDPYIYRWPQKFDKLSVTPSQLQGILPHTCVYQSRDYFPSSQLGDIMSLTSYGILFSSDIPLP